ncbi:MAG: ATP-binding cassette domain-containing protein, partial [Pseudonocardiales bacterium]|nr:ATP-binding cassette domain-containing protein [Pseudonocardiales bacterium]
MTPERTAWQAADTERTAHRGGEQTNGSAPGLGHRDGVAPGLGHSNGGRPTHGGDYAGGGDPDGVVELSGIWRRFGSTPPVIALRGVDLLVRRGEWLAIAGPSGSGKSTLLNVIGCLDRPDEGSYLLDGIDITTLTDDQRAGVRSRRIGFVFQAFHLLAHRTVVENVMLAEVYGGQPRSGRRERALAALAAVGLGERGEHLPTKLSGGERQRVAI